MVHEREVDLHPACVDLTKDLPIPAQCILIKDMGRRHDPAPVCAQAKNGEAGFFRKVELEFGPAPEAQSVLRRGRLRETRNAPLLAPFHPDVGEPVFDLPRGIGDTEGKARDGLPGVGVDGYRGEGG